MKNETIEIPLSKTKIIFLILGSIAFVAIALWELVYMADNQTSFNPSFIKVAAILGIVVFSFTGIVGIKKMFDKRPGLIINQEGIDVNSSGMKIGLIKWEDIIGFSVFQIMSTKLLMIKVCNPDDYINKASNTFISKMMKANNSQYGTPLSISSNALKIDFDSLHKLLREKFEESRIRTNNEAV
jgi:hypothetical protein